MRKLYLRINDFLHYHEAWVQDRTVIEHWGKVGERGETRAHPLMDSEVPDQGVARVLSGVLARGYDEIDVEDMHTLVIEHPVVGMGSKTDLRKRHELEDRLNETLGWTGLGACDGGSMGSDSMEVFCDVVDVDIAKAIIEDDLADTGFSDYARIFEMEKD
jgi:hypothetical protein